MAGHTLKRRLWRWAPGAFVLGFVLALALFGGTGYAAPENVHLAVYQWAAQHPGQEVPVILRTSGDQASAGETVTSFGGKVEQNLDFISAIQADVPASAIRELAASDGVSNISLNAPVYATTASASSTQVTTYPQSIGADVAWAQGFFGDSVGVAVVDTGFSPVNTGDFTTAGGQSRVVAKVELSSNSTVTTDGYGHGSHVAGSAVGNGSADGGKYVGVAPHANLISVKIADDQGGATMGDLLAGLDWVHLNAATYNIRVVNLSLNSSVAASYKTDPLDAAVEALWFQGIMVVVASGNSGTAAGSVTYPPANDPFVLTVGSIDDKGTTSTSDDVVSSFTSRGTTQDGFNKPEIYTPGSNIVSSAAAGSVIYNHALAANKIMDGAYVSLSGTSMAAGVASGAAALVFQAHPAWTPGQVKCTLMAKVRTVADWTSTVRVPSIGLVTAATAPTCDSNTGKIPTGLFGRLMKVGAVAWLLDQPNRATAAATIGFTPLSAIPGNSHGLASVRWDLIAWSSIKWSSVKWSSVKWDSIKWSSIKWSSIKWSDVSDAGVSPDAIKWDTVKWASVDWSSVKWNSVDFYSIKWSSEASPVNN
jgi:serine protease AprX